MVASVPDAEEFTEPLMVEDDFVAGGKNLERELAEAKRALAERDATIEALNRRLGELEQQVRGFEAKSGVRSLPAEPPRSSHPVLPLNTRDDSAPSVAPTTTPYLGSERVMTSFPPPAAPRLPLPSSLPVPNDPASSTEDRTEVQWHAVGICAPGRYDSVPPSQRQLPRRICELAIEFNEDTHFYAGLTRDLSEGGVFIATYHLHPIGTLLELSFDLPCGTHVTARAQVRWLRETDENDTRPGMGVAFLELPERALEAIARFCRDKPPLYVEFTEE